MTHVRQDLTLGLVASLGGGFSKSQRLLGSSLLGNIVEDEQHPDCLARGVGEEIGTGTNSPVK